MNEERLISIVGRLYEAAGDPGLLPTVNSAIEEALGTHSSLMFVADHRSGKLVHLIGASENYTAEARAAYSEHYHRLNPWYGGAVGQPGGFVRHGAEYISYHDFDRTEFRADWCRKVGIYHMMGGVAPLRSGLVIACGVHRREQDTSFNEDDKRVFGLLMRHVGRACQLADRLGAFAGRERLTLELISRLEAGLLILDAASRPMLVNPAAERLLRASRWITKANGIVRPINPSQCRQFAQSVGLAAATSAGDHLAGGDMCDLHDPIEGAMPVLIVPFSAGPLGLPGPSGAGGAAAILFHDPDSTSSPGGDAVAAVFGLTAAEGRLAAALLQGLSLVATAAQLGISNNTAKTQLQSIFDKTGCSRQSELASLLRSNSVLRFRAAMQSVNPSGSAHLSPATIQY